MPNPAPRTEIEEITGYLADQIRAIRTSAHGLTEEQARQRPTRSTLSIGGLVKHATYVLDNRPRHLAEPEKMPDEDDFARFLGSFALAEEETLSGALAAYDEATVRYLADVAAADPDAEATEPPAPWDGRMHPSPSRSRFALLHHLEELARHAGHADIIREALDGATAPELDAAVEGRPANDWVTPWAPSS